MTMCYTELHLSQYLPHSNPHSHSSLIWLDTGIVTPEARFYSSLSCQTHYDEVKSIVNGYAVDPEPTLHIAPLPHAPCRRFGIDLLILRQVLDETMG